ncbi:MAG: ATP-binding protein [Novosphingobium sp.]|nr:ATP-binding protein [Novosphingobium sp.]
MTLWPRSLQGQLLSAIAVALFVAQGLGALLLYRAQAERREELLVNSAAFRLASAVERMDGSPDPLRNRWIHDGGREHHMRFRVRVADRSPQLGTEPRHQTAERALALVLTREGVDVAETVVVERAIRNDPVTQQWIRARGEQRFKGMGMRPHEVVIAAVRRPDGSWLHARIPIPPGTRGLPISMLLQTLLIYAVLVGAVALVLRRITRPLAAVIARMENFAGTRNNGPPLQPEGPDDIRDLIVAHNSLEARVAALLDEKDVMLGAIGHDLKTPLAALRVRIESVEDDTERGKMAATIEDINRSLDDILSLARVGRPSDPLEPTELGALAAAVVEEYEDQGKPVTIADGPRIVLPARATWLRRLLRNLIDNALRYGGQARVSLVREGGFAVLRIEDEGPGIPETEIARMLEPFTRLEASRNSATGGAGLGLTLARAVAEQHGGALRLANRTGGGLVASVSLPLV